MGAAGFEPTPKTPGENEKHDRDTDKSVHAVRNGSDTLASALAMIERLPLSDDEKIEAVRRLLGD